VDYKVRIFQGGSDAVTRVLIEFQDSAGERWTTVGVSDNIIDASFQALTDSMTYKLPRSARKHRWALRCSQATGREGRMSISRSNLAIAARQLPRSVMPE
jgi:LeuA allosteric (dimerisation) domain